MSTPLLHEPPDSPNSPGSPDSPSVCYLAPEGGETRLEEELNTLSLTPFQRYGRLFVCFCPISSPTAPSTRTPYWVQNIWQTPHIQTISSIQQAAKLLRSIQKQWALWQVHAHRRSHLIQEALPTWKHAPLSFPNHLSHLTHTHPIGSWCLLNPETLLYSPSCSSCAPHGEWNFQEARPYHSTLPPSRAYLKLWEACSRLKRYPLPHERCLELGASPGSWTWALSLLGTQVTAVDRAPLAPGIETLPGVHFTRGDAFQYTPERVGKIDWIFSDLICYPEKLLEFLLPWVHSGLCRNFICTLKFQGTPKREVIDRFAAIPGSQLMHLFHNKNELTWISHGLPHELSHRP